MHFFDAHCHLDHAEFQAPGRLEPLIQRMRESQTTAVTHGTDAESNRRQLDLVRAHPDLLKAACGLDPFHAAKEDLSVHMAFLEAAHKDGRLAAVGEIGLDLHYFGPETLARQKEVFEAQLAFGEKHGLACVIHTRKAVDEVLAALPSFKGVHVLHFFLEKKHAAKALDVGCYLSIPTVKSKDRTAIIKAAPLDRLLTETDSPYGWGKDAHGKPQLNEPANVREVYEQIASTLDKDLNDVRDQINQNAQTVFRHGKT